MVRVQVYLDEDEDRWLEERARTLGMTKSGLVREGMRLVRGEPVPTQDYTERLRAARAAAGKAESRIAESRAAYAGGDQPLLFIGRRPHMVRVQLHLSDEDGHWLEDEVRPAGISRSEAIRAAVRVIEARVTPHEEDPLWQLVGLAGPDPQGPTDVAERHDWYLVEWEIERNRLGAADLAATEAERK